MILTYVRLKRGGFSPMSFIRFKSLGGSLNHLKAHAPILAAVMFGIGAAYAQQPPNASSASTPPATSPPAAPPTAAAPATASPPVAAAPSTPSAALLRQAKLAGY